MHSVSHHLVLMVSCIPYSYIFLSHLNVFITITKDSVLLGGGTQKGKDGPNIVMVLL